MLKWVSDNSGAESLGKRSGTAIAKFGDLNWVCNSPVKRTTISLAICSTPTARNCLQEDRLEVSEGLFCIILEDIF